MPTSVIKAEKDTLTDGLDASLSDSSLDSSLDNSLDNSDSFLRDVARIDEVLPPPKKVEAPGHRFGDRYSLLSLLGAGGQGAVWDAEDLLTHERVAVKILRTVSNTCAARVRREIAVLRLLRLPGVLRLVDEGMDGDRPFLVTERVFGRPFPGVSIPCTWPELEPVLISLLETLARIHAAGILHRDLKPDNVLVGPDKRPVVLDFGLSFPTTDARDRLTDTGQIVGTLSYVAPEQLREARPTARSDLYSVGVMAYFALTGHVPHEQRDMCNFILARIGKPAPSLIDVAPLVPPEVAIVLDQLLAIDPAERPRSAVEVTTKLRDRLLPSTRTSEIPPPLRRFLIPQQTSTAGASTGPLLHNELALKEIFSGPDRLLHLREDGARILFSRTGGDPERVRQELEAWVRAGLARWDGDRVSIGRDAIEELDAGLVVLANDSDRASKLSLSKQQWELLAWIALAGAHASAPILASAMGEHEDDVEAEVADLLQLGVISALPEGRYEPVVWPGVDEIFSPERLERAHRELARALPRGAMGRLVHLLKGAAELDRHGAAEVAREVMHTSFRLAAEGRTARAMLLIGEGVRALRENPHLAEEERVGLFAAWVDIALAENTPIALDRVLYELSRPLLSNTKGVNKGEGSPELLHLASLVRAALAGGSWTLRALSQANQVAPFSDPALERRRHGVRMLAARRASLAVEEATLSEVLTWADASNDPAARAQASGWLGRLRYRQGRFDEAAACHTQAAAGAPWLVTMLWARLLASSALLEAFRFGEARVEAASALTIARHCRHALCEGRAAWVLRSVDYRTGALDAGPCDLELVEATSFVGAADLEALVCLNESAVAMRAGAREVSAKLAERAFRVWWPLQERVGSLLCAGLLVASGATLPETELRAVVDAALVCPIPGVGIQALALLRDVLSPAELLSAKPLAELVPPLRWDERMDVLSVNEALAAVSTGS